MRRLIIGLAVVVVFGVGQMAALGAPGDLLQTFSPPGTGYRFGLPAVAFGDQVLIGDYWIDKAYVYDPSDGNTPVHTFSNPTPISSGYPDTFGYSMTAVGSDKIVIGAHGDDAAGSAAGAAYLYSYSGTTWTREHDWLGSPSESFGEAMAAYGDNVLISAPANDVIGTDAGAVHLYDSSTGSKLHTFYGEAAGDSFGYIALAGSGNQVAVGGLYNDAGASEAGAAYVYTQTGDLTEWSEKKILNPSPASSDRFGSSIDWLGDNLLIGAKGAGEVYVYDGSGENLLLTIPNPTAEGGQHGFGTTVDAVGDNILVSHPSYNSNEGIVYLFDGSQRGVYSGDPLLTISNPDPSTLWTFGHNTGALGNNILIGAPQTPGGGWGGRAYLFEGQPVPEPSTFILLTMGAAGLLAYGWRRRRAL